jgi:hypothetical protein
MSQNSNLVGRTVSRERYQRGWSQVELVSKPQLPGVLRDSRDPNNPLVGGLAEPNGVEAHCGRLGVALTTGLSTTQCRQTARGCNSPWCNSSTAADSPMKSGLCRDGIVPASVHGGGKL